MFASIVTGLVLAVLPLVTATSGNFPAHLSYDVAKSLFSKRILLSDNPVSFVPKGVWVGTDGLYTINFINHSSHDLGLVVWAPHVFSSFVTLITPSLTVSITSGSNLTISFDYGSAGAWSAVYPDTPSYSDQIPNTWGEFTFGSVSMFDVSRQLNMSGYDMSIEGPTCKADRNTCVFVCSMGDNCAYGYQLRNCTSSSQEGARSYGKSSGGCIGPGPQGGNLTTTFF
ncbi:hypothetical protein MBLNU459_g4360t2 [Dothideomycetes sp. NU459]